MYTNVYLNYIVNSILFKWPWVSLCETVRNHLKLHEMIWSPREQLREIIRKNMK